MGEDGHGLFLYPSVADFYTARLLLWPARLAEKQKHMFMCKGVRCSATMAEISKDLEVELGAN